MLIYCLKCKKKTNTLNMISTTTKNGKSMVKGTCEVCNKKKSIFVKSK